MKALRFGKLPPRHDYRTLRFKNYLKKSIAPPPASFDVLPKVFTKLKTTDAGKLFPMDANDQWGDCTIAALAHAGTVFNGLVGKKKIWSQQAVVKLYFQLTGGADSGLDGLTVMNYWQSHLAAGEKIVAFAAIDLKNHTHVMQAIQLFGGVFLGFQCQEKVQDEFENGQPWQPGTLTNDGHAVFATAYDSQGVTVLTWGSTQKATWGWWDECVDEAYAILPPQAKKITFSGFDFAALQADLADVAG